MDLTKPPRRFGPALVLTFVLVSSVAAGCGGSATPSADGSSANAPRSTSTSAPSESASPAGTPSAQVKPAAPVPVEKNPPGDIPDNLAFVPYTNRPGGYSFTHPEGWARTGSGVRVRFTDKLNGVTAESMAATQAPTVANAHSSDVARLKSSVPAFELRNISAVTLPAGKGVHIVFRRNSDADPVTGKVYRDEVEEYDVFRAGKLVRLDLYGPVGADNVDAYRTMSQSLRLP
ncbi:MAG: hypothetical protein JWR90_3940 [Marmoricola sp.]|jgi:hypothetical protein|nr:hypothetical protein [Marmoricola sp.]